MCPVASTCGASVASSLASSATDDGARGARAAAAGGPVRLPAGVPVAAGLLAGALADKLLGDPRRGHPVAGFGRAAAALERRAWRPSRAAGAAYTLALVGGAAGVAALADTRLRRRPAARLLLLAGLTWTALGGRSLGRTARQLGDAVRRGDLERARRVAPALVGRDPSGLGGAELCRAAVESVAENTADAVIGPLLWGALAGPAGVAVYRAANTLDAMIGHRSPRYLRFGWAAARLDDLLTWPAARLGALLTCLLAAAGAAAGDGDRGRAWRVLRRDGTRHPSPNAGRMEAAFAGALGVRLGGRNRYGDRVEERPALGEGLPPGPDDVDRAVRLSGRVGAAALAFSMALAALRAHATVPGRARRPAPLLQGLWITPASPTTNLLGWLRGGPPRRHAARRVTGRAWRARRPTRSLPTRGRWRP
jgi:adenosylcobinamide-phosphate synthase